jgi:hypothetical protein
LKTVRKKPAFTLTEGIPSTGTVSVIAQTVPRGITHESQLLDMPQTIKITKSLDLHFFHNQDYIGVSGFTNM